MSGLTLIAIGAIALLLLSKKSGTGNWLPEGGTPGGTIPTSSAPRRSPPALPSNPSNDQIAAYNAQIDEINAYNVAHGYPPYSYYLVDTDQTGNASDSEWYNQAVKDGGGLISQTGTTITSMASAVYNWAQGVGESVTRRVST